MKLFAPHVADGYKPGHRPLYPKGTQLLYGNMTARADRLFLKSPSCSELWDNRVVWVGIQGVMLEIKELWDESFFSKPKDQVIARYERRMRHYLGEGKIPSDGFAALHDLGYLPISVLALPEGSRVNMNVPFYTIYNTLPEFFWLVNYLETSMSAMLWKMVTNATISYEYRRTLEAWAERTGSPKDFVSVQGHDFSYRGVGGLEDGARSGFPHLCNFVGSDTMPAMDYAEDYYGADAEHEFLACSLTATEHSVATANILSNLQSSRVPGDDFQIARLEAERQFILRVLTETNSNGGVALVCDSFNFWGVLTDVLTDPTVQAAVMSRGKDETGLCKTVVRPDSGDPVEVICGVEVLTLGGRDAAFEKRQDVVFYKDGERVFRATRVVGKSYNKTWTELDASVGSNDEWRVLSAPLRIFNSAGFPSHLKYEEVAYFEVMKQCVAYLGERGIVVERVEIGNYDRGYRIEGHTLSPVEKGAVQLLWETFGGTVTDKGFRVLDEHIGLIYGDSITVKRTQEIMRRLADKGFASCNVVLGIGSFTYQYNTRDTFGMAIKATCCQVDGELIELYKDPMTEGETAKKSAKGFLVVDRVDGDFVLRQEQPLRPEDLATGSGELKQMFCDGVLTNPATLAEIRARLASA